MKYIVNYFVVIIKKKVFLFCGYYLKKSFCWYSLVFCPSN